ncbi:hypothetical protein CDAR_387701 [Caerostris darwini]|uniref:Uncharacterized protein n=1 Tax=Caerostris darwini TaxID=1538125 RepID=A0AAV4W5H4_9ARAC|nr:hypothetical protein CDAR_387701 [Caerostris darwini]
MLVSTFPNSPRFSIRTSFAHLKGSTEQPLAVTCILSSPTPERPLKPLCAPGGVALSSIHWGKQRSRNQISRTCLPTLAFQDFNATKGPTHKGRDPKVSLATLPRNVPTFLNPVKNPE